jgi:transposase InsO family protein
LTALTSVNVPFQFGAEAKQAFQELKTCLTRAPILALPDPDQPFGVVCDASGFGVGAVLMQNGRAIAYYSYKLNSAECNYPVAFSGELLAVIRALQQWRCYLEGPTGGLTIVTDPKPNTVLDTKPPVQLSRRQVRWQDLLTRFQPYKWEHRQGKCSVADPISRSPALLMTSQAQEPVDTATILDDSKRGYALDSWFADDDNTVHLTLDGELWKISGTIVVPDVDKLRKRCIALHHDPPYAGHLGELRTLRLIQQTYWWPTMSQDVKACVSTCDLCQRNKASNRKPAGRLHPVQIPGRRWGSVSMDLITQLPMTNHGHTAIVVFVDRLSKRVHFVPAHTEMSSEEFAHVFLREVFAKHGLPDDLVSDRDPRFTSAFWTEVCRHLGVKRFMSTASHPQSDGQTGRANRVLEDMLRNYVAMAQDDWEVRVHPGNGQ